jgi:hypothetical protein
MKPRIGFTNRMRVQAFNQRVAGSIPARPTTINTRLVLFVVPRQNPLCGSFPARRTRRGTKAARRYSMSIPRGALR